MTEFYFVSLDIFLEIEDNKSEDKKLSELAAWLFFIASDQPKHIQRILHDHPKFTQLYEEIIAFRHHPEEAIQMFSDALRKLDENTVKFMIDEMKEEMKEELKEEYELKLQQELSKQLAQHMERQRKEFELTQNKLEQENARLRQLLSEKEMK